MVILAGHSFLDELLDLGARDTAATGRAAASTENRESVAVNPGEVYRDIRVLGAVGFSYHVETPSKLNLGMPRPTLTAGHLEGQSPTFR